MAEISTQTSRSHWERIQAKFTAEQKKKGLIKKLVQKLITFFVVCQDWNNIGSELVKASAAPQNKKGRTITFRVDDEVAEKFEKYAKIRNTSISRVLRNWC